MICLALGFEEANAMLGLQIAKVFLDIIEAEVANEWLKGGKR